MASSRPRKSAKKDGKTALQEAIDECDQLLEKTKKPRKKTRFRISRDPLTGRRKSRYPYKPRFQDDAQSISGPHHEPDGKVKVLIQSILIYFTIDSVVLELPFIKFPYP